MDIEVLKNAIATSLSDSQVTLDGEGCQLTAWVVSPHFQGLSLVRRQQQVYAAVAPWLKSGELHAFTIKAFTPDEWEKQQTAIGACLTRSANLLKAMNIDRATRKR